MGALAVNYESGLIKHFFLSEQLAYPTTVYIGLVSNYSADDLRNNIQTSEITGASGFERQPAPCTADVWKAPYATGTGSSASYATNNISGINFPVAEGSKGIVSGVIITSAQTGGNIIFHGPLTNAREIRDKDIFQFPSGALKITFS